MFQFVLKGIADVTDAEALAVFDSGLLCSWWRRVSVLPFEQVGGRLTEPELHAHLSDYKALVPGEQYTVGENSPFISTTAGTYQTHSSKTYEYYSAQWTAARFATDTFRKDGVIFRAWLPILGRPSVPVEQFAEEVRDPNQYSTVYGYHHQGEVTAKIRIPPVQIEGFWRVSVAAVKSTWGDGSPLSLGPATALNPSFVLPEDFSNVRNEA